MSDTPPPPGHAAALHTLAYGALTDEDRTQLTALKQQISESIGFRCDGYKEKCLRRRIAVRMRARAVHSFAAYAALLASDPDEYRRLLEAVTINVSKFFRNAEVWETIRTRVLPDLADSDAPEIRIWSAGCAAGEECYTIAMLVLDLARERGIDPKRFIITGTDIDRTTLAVASQGVYGDFAFSEIDPALRERWFEPPHYRRVRPEVRALVRFAPLDLITEHMPSAQHLIFCRNVIIYFERTIQEELFGRFHATLVPGGYLVLGKVETLFGPASRSFRSVAARERIFHKP